VHEQMCFASILMPKFLTRFFRYSIFLLSVYHAIGKKITALPELP
jgi:hypothetical protein